MQQEESKPRKTRADKQLPKPRTRYYVGEPVIVLPLAEYERLANHLTDIALLDRKTQTQRLALFAKHSLVLREMRTNIRAAKTYYLINQTKTDA